MRRTLLLGLSLAALAALKFAGCDSSQTSNTALDMAVAAPDMTVDTTPDMTADTPDMVQTGDMVTAPVAPTEFSVVRIGTGNGGLNNDATAAFIERRKISDGTLVGAALALPTAVNGANKQLTLSGLATVEGQLSRSADGRYLLIAGYAANPGVNNISTSSSTTYNRVVGRIDAAGNINTSTASAAYNGQAVRGATSTDGNAIWISSDAGIGYTTLGSTAMPTSLSTVVSRAIDIFGAANGRQLYISSAGGGNLGVNTVGTGTPMTTATVTRLMGFTDTNSPSSVGYVGFDRDNNGAIDQLYVADDRTVAGGGVQRWKLNGNSWTLEGTISTGTGTGARYVTGFVSGTTVTILATTAELAAQPRVVALTDNGGTTAQVTSKTLATAGNNTTYRGIALAPNP
jgi:hypothetical protein